MYKKFIINNGVIQKLSTPLKTMPVSVKKENIKETLINYFTNTSIDNGCLKASEINNIIYPLKDCHVFISHSSKDKEVAEKLADWLWSNFNIKSFIDSLFWGNIAELQLEMDKKICKYYENEKSWDYSDRNYSTAYVHMLLSNAITEMIKNTECFIFISSNNSITIDENGFEKDTSSPWIFHELYTVNTIQPIIPKRLKQYKESHECFSESTQQYLNFDVTNEISQLQSISLNDLTNWPNWQKIHNKKGEYALDYLYGKKTNKVL